MDNRSGPTPNKREISPRTFELDGLEMHPIQCNNEDDFRGHADIHPQRQRQSVVKFCNQVRWGYKPFTRDDDIKQNHLRGIRRRYTDGAGVNHDFRIIWEGGCRTTAHEQSPYRPLPGDSGPNCYQIMKWNFRNCTNGGVGGSTKLGCLVYTYNGGLGGRRFSNEALWRSK
ncbi:hypothetical protein CCHL11_06540 [Colletotrichum chlorophyti]|uniref:Uncharacterized protein n=1 Tax=Colletotrichum chlorophyti TaxID=708187 RepID=A0A1Q8RRR7_9PEZI|nr:hypothetical protein CCHL11_06540 [Colletotrichum chlorophyti]